MATRLLILALLVGLPLGGAFAQSNSTTTADQTEADAQAEAEKKAAEMKAIAAESHAAVVAIEAEHDIKLLKAEQRKALLAASDCNIIVDHLQAAREFVPKAIRRREACDDDLVYCMQRGPEGKSESEDNWPAKALPGDVIQLRLLVPLGAEKAPYVIHPRQVRSRQMAFKVRKDDRADTPQSAALAERETEACKLEPIKTHIEGIKKELRVRHSASLELEVPDDSQVIRVGFELTGPGKTGLIETLEHKWTYIQHGSYFFDVGLMFPVAFGHDKDVVVRDLPGENSEVLVERDEDITTALVLNVYPFGRDNDRISSFVDPRGNVDGGHGQWLGFQLGVDVLDKPLDRVYFGVLFEPVNGFAISGGAAFIKGKRPAAGFAEGKLVADGTQVDAVDFYDLTPYVGVTLSTEVVESFRAAASKLGGSGQSAAPGDAAGAEADGE